MNIYEKLETILTKLKAPKNQKTILEIIITEVVKIF